MANAFTTLFNNIFVHDLPEFLMSEPIIYFVAFGLLCFAVATFKKIIK